MKTLLLSIALLIATVTLSQEKWRRISVSTGTAIGMNDIVVSKASVNLFYELDKKYSLQVWGGYVGSTTNEWVGAKSVLIRNIKGGFKFESGLYYENGARDGLNLGVVDRNLFIGIRVTKEFKL
jgi:hypothetical protein|tara:strand:+ start:184 stop:555 length:372 start_codon:yes stop_codon:yes gene_type:complete